jgi:arylsulfatase A-like enzyme
MHPGTTPYDRGFERAFTLVGDGGNHFTNGSIFPGGKTIYVQNDTRVERPGNGTLFSNDLYTDNMIEYINQTQGDGKPLFMYLAFQVAHSPFMSPPETIEKYSNIYSAGWDQIREQRFEKQKELGIWPANMTLSPGQPQNEPWGSLNQNEKDYAAKILAVRAAMIENMDQNIGRLVDHLNQTGQYDNTVIVFTSDNGGSEAAQLPEGILLFNGVDYTAIPGFVKDLNNTLPNLGKLNTEINSGAWGPYVSSAPLSGFKASLYEGGTRVPFIIKEPTDASAASASASAAPASNTTTTAAINSSMFVTDLTPTFLDYANVPHPGSTYNGTEVHPMMGKSIRPLVNGSTAEIHAIDEPIGMEMFNNTAVYEGSWVAINVKSHPTGNG